MISCFIGFKSGFASPHEFQQKLNGKMVRIRQPLTVKVCGRQVRTLRPKEQLTRKMDLAYACFRTASGLALSLRLDSLAAHKDQCILLQSFDSSLSQVATPRFSVRGCFPCSADGGENLAGAATYQPASAPAQCDAIAVNAQVAEFH